MIGVLEDSADYFRTTRETGNVLRHAQHVMGPSNNDVVLLVLVLDLSFFGFFNGIDLGFSHGPSNNTLINDLQT